MSKKRRRNASNNQSFEIHVEPKTEVQRLFLNSIKQNKLTICDGPAGCGKTYTLVNKILPLFIMSL